MAFLLYANTIGHDYAWDDSIVITDNPRVKKGFKGIPDLFIKYNSDYRADKYGYRPIVLTSFAVEYALFKAKPAVGHFMNVFYFSLLCAAMFGVLRRIFYRLSNLAPFLITFLFLVHPVHVEAVANIKSRDELFALLFSLLALKHFILYHQKSKLTNLFASIVLFLLGFLSKESVAVFLLIMPLTLLVMDEHLSLNKMLRPALYTISLFAVCFAVVVLYTSSQRGTELSKGAGIFYESGILGNSFFYTSVISTKLANAFTVLYVYLFNFFVPVRQLYYYGYNQVPVASWGQPGVIASFIIHGALLLFALFKWRLHREISYGVLFYFISIFIYTHLFKTLSDTLADRFLFSPSLGLSIMTVFALGKFCKIDFRSLKADTVLRFGNAKNQAPGAAVYVLLCVCVLLAFKTFFRNKVWKNDLALVSHDMPYLENCARAHSYYADLLKVKLSSGFDATTEALMIDHYKKSYTISPESYYAYMGLGTYYCSVKRYGEGISVLDTMVHRFPEQADPHFYLGQALSHEGNYKEAIYHLERSLKLAPEVLMTYYTLSTAYSKNRDFEKALATVETARKKFTDSGVIYDALGNIYYEMGDMEQATKNTFELLRFGENPQKVYGLIIGRYQNKKQDSLALLYYKEAVGKNIFKPGAN